VGGQVSDSAAVDRGRPAYTAHALATALDELEDYRGHDIAAILARATELERAAANLGDRVLEFRARLVQADMSQRNGDVGPAARTYLEIHRWAQEHDCGPLRARCHFHLALTYHYLGDHAASLEHAVASVELLDGTSPPGLHLNHLIRLANSLAEAGSVTEARQRYAQAEELAVACGDLTRQLLVLNNLAYTEYQVGDLERAWAVVGRMHDTAGALGRDFLIVELDTIARIQLSRGDHAAAERTVQVALDGSPSWYEVHDLADAALTLAQAQRLQGGLDRAQASLDRCRELCEERELAGVRLRVLAEQAELYAAKGDYRGAYEEFKRFHAADEQLRSTQQEARARTRQTMFEVAEARQVAARYHEQARRDPLTGLHNRRYVDEQLAPAIARAAQAGTPLAVALVDLDHFKRVNDTLSHHVGDQVLMVIAALLADAQKALAPAGFAARLGGEEFLLVLPELGMEATRRGLDALRRTIRSHPWRELTGELPVTVSVGAAGAEEGPCTSASLLAEADRRLYTAKRTGRDRVVTGALAGGGAGRPRMPV
jgi:diguanylate cyclase (GGDEF)-like protein